MVARKLEIQGRKVVMVVDNCLAHPEVSGLKAVVTVFATKYHFLYTVDGSWCNQVCLLYHFHILLTKSIE